MTLKTKMMYDATVTLEQTLTHNTLCALWGEAGLGKTFATDAFIAGLNDCRVAKFDAPVLATVRSVCLELLKALSGAAVDCPTASALVEIRAVLDEELPTLIVVDEAQRMKTQEFEVLRSLHDRHKNFALAFVGGPGAWKVLSAEEMLVSRITFALEFRPLAFDEFRDLLPGYDGMFEGIAEPIARLVYAACHGGNLRDLWQFVMVVSAMLPADRRTITPDVIKAVRLRRGR
jgi:DNA transposition AAA+ family ATPase